MATTRMIVTDSHKHCDTCCRNMKHRRVVYTDAEYWTCYFCGTKTEDKYLGKVKFAESTKKPKQKHIRKKLGRPRKENP